MDKEGIVVYSKKGDIIFTSTGEIKVVEKKNIRTNKNIVNLVFDNLKKYNTTNNKDMENFLLNASRNIFEKKFKYINGILYKKEFKKKSDFYINSNDLENTYSLLEHFIFGDKSNEIKITNIDQNEFTDNLSGETKNLINVNELLNSYIIVLKNKNELTYTETLELDSFLKTIFLAEFITVENFVLENKIIKNIKNVTYDDKKRYFYLDNYITPKILKKEFKKIVKNEMWNKKVEKFLSHMIKNM